MAETSAEVWPVAFGDGWVPLGTSHPAQQTAYDAGRPKDATPFPPPDADVSRLRWRMNCGAGEPSQAASSPKQGAVHDSPSTWLSLFAAVAVSSTALADEAPYRIYMGRDYRGYTVQELQKRVYDLERAVMQLQQRVYNLEAARRRRRSSSRHRHHPDLYCQRFRPDLCADGAEPWPGRSAGPQAVRGCQP